MTKNASHPTAHSSKIGSSTGADERKDERSLPHCGDHDFRIARDGTWFYRGSAIARPALVRVFSTILRCEEDGRHWLVTPVERSRIDVDDAPFLAVELLAQGEGDLRVLRFRTNVDDVVEAGPDHPIEVVIDADSGEPSPYILVRGRLKALIVRSVYYQLAELAEERMVAGKSVLGVNSRTCFFVLGSLE